MKVTKKEIVVAYVPKNKPKTGKQIIELVKLHSNGFVSTVGINKNKLYRGKDKYFIKCNVHTWHKTQKKTHI